MQIADKHYRTIWQQGEAVQIIDQLYLPFELVIESIATTEEMAKAICEMRLRGAPLIGAAGAWGAWLAAGEVASGESRITDQGRSAFFEKLNILQATRPTAINLRWALERQRLLLKECSDWTVAAEVMKAEAQNVCDEDVAICEAIGDHGVTLLEQIAAGKSGEPVNILTHCNAGWLATIDYGTATAPIYKAKEKNIAVHVWVSETRPRLQGAKLTAYELEEEGIPYTVIADNAAGHLMQHGMVDICLVGTDRTTRAGDVANKIGTYLKALAAKVNNVPFYAAVPSPSIDWSISDGVLEIPIEERSGDEVCFIEGQKRGGKDAGKNAKELATVAICPKQAKAANYGFDVTPRDLITGLITERGIAEASSEGLQKLFPERSTLSR